MKNQIQKNKSEDSGKLQAKQTLLSRFRNNPELVYGIYSDDEHTHEGVNNWNDCLINYNGIHQETAIDSLCDTKEDYLIKILEDARNGEISVPTIIAAVLAIEEPSDDFYYSQAMAKFENLGGHENYKQELIATLENHPRAISKFVNNNLKIFGKAKEIIVNANDARELMGDNAGPKKIGPIHLNHCYGNPPYGIPSLEGVSTNGLLSIDNNTEGLVKQEHYEEIDSELGKFFVPVAEKLLKTYEDMGFVGGWTRKDVLANVFNRAWNYGFKPENLIERVSSLEAFSGNYEQYAEVLEDYLKKC
jgi:hypothetical protein